MTNPDPHLEPNRHALERTSPKGQPFIGRCIKCGKTGLTFRDMQTETCANPSGMTQGDALLSALANPNTPGSEGETR